MSLPLTDVSAATPPAAAPRLRLEFLDGVRGLAALYVVLFHAFQLATFDNPHINGNLVWRFGHPAVSVFIVLSGFCLMLPVVRSLEGRLPGGVWEYLKRRARRILPPYYAALVLSAIFLAAAHLAKYHSGLTLRDPTLARHFSPGSLLSHLVLLHNWNKDWVETIDVPMWSVATEWQIYFFLPALLLPVWRRFGLGALLVVGFGVGLLPHYLLPAASNFDWACPWYLGLFSLGMAGAALAFAPRPAPWAKQVPWRGLAGALFLLLGLLLAFLSIPVVNAYVWATDALAGAAILCFILGGAQEVAQPGAVRPFLVRALESGPALRLGAFSYSLYLVHYPLLNKVVLLLAGRQTPLGVRLLVMYGAAVPLAAALSYLFYLFCEKPYASPRRGRRSAELHLR